MKLEKNLKLLFPYTLTLIAAFFLVPLYAAYSDEKKVVSILLIGLLMINPAVSFLTALFFTIRNGFHWSLLITVVILFLIAVFLFYGMSLCVYLPIYIIAALMGSFLGAIFKKWTDEMWM